MSEVHIGRNIRAIRLLQGMKQEVFAQKMGISQQNISKLEGKMNVSSSKLEAVAKVLGVSVEAIERFNEKALLYADPDQKTHQLGEPVKEIISYFKDEIVKRDQLIDQLRTELDKIRLGLSI
ncbi:MAG: hypothetical protein BGO55_03380 [Sphingobacteriales bacterium 50-39]|nr:helix-turn-helix transcriptional regulator [Sphingobacteriales bacterium]OJW55596.1 MAG: hypothetical protein BGO55_03380 [Sphingobacteriales bacterium 50-39]